MGKWVINLNFLFKKVCLSINDIIWVIEWNNVINYKIIKLMYGCFFFRGFYDLYNCCRLRVIFCKKNNNFVLLWNISNIYNDWM